MPLNSASVLSMSRAVPMVCIATISAFCLAACASPEQDRSDTWEQELTGRGFTNITEDPSSGPDANKLSADASGCRVEITLMDNFPNYLIKITTSEDETILLENPVNVSTVTQHGGLEYCTSPVRLGV